MRRRTEYKAHERGSLHHLQLRLSQIDKMAARDIDIHSIASATSHLQRRSRSATDSSHAAKSTAVSRRSKSGESDVVMQCEEMYELTFRLWKTMNQAAQNLKTSERIAAMPMVARTGYERGSETSSSGRKSVTCMKRKISGQM